MSSENVERAVRRCTSRYDHVVKFSSLVSMDHDDLVAFIRDEMRMQHIYQPLLIKTLVECGGSATVRQLAQAVLALDESQSSVLREANQGNARQGS